MSDLVLLHGWGMNAGVWSGLPPALGQRYRLHPIELPGHGESSLNAEPSLTGWAQAILAAAPVRAIWLGWSLGGLIALQAAQLAPERIDALILMTATPRFVQGSDWPHAMPLTTLQQFQRALLENPRETLDRFLALQVRGSVGARETLRQLRRELRQRPAPQPAALEIGLELLRTSDLRAILPQLPMPSLWLFGQRDPLVPAALGRDLEPLSPRGRIHIFSGAAHAPFLSHPQAVLEAMLDFGMHHAHR